MKTSTGSFLHERLARLWETLDETSRLAAAGELPNVELDDQGVKMAPLDDETSAVACFRTQQVYDVMPRLEITICLLEFDQWTAFTSRDFPCLTPSPIVTSGDEEPA